MTSKSPLSPERLARVTHALAADLDGNQRSLCAVSASVTQVNGAGVVLIMHGRPLGIVCCSDPVIETIEEIQYTLGEGPCMDVASTREPVLVPDLRATDLVRWPGFREGALAAGITGVFGFPIVVGSICIGVLDLYQHRSGVLTDEQLADAVVVAHLAGRTVLGWQARAGAGSLASQLDHLWSDRAVVHQATGMVAVQASVTVDDAVTLLRAYAFSTDRPLNDVAGDVVRGELRFD